MKSSIRPYRTTFYLWNGVSAIFFSSCITNVHSHNTMQIIVDIQGRFKCRINNGEWETHKYLIIRENVVHQLDTNDSVQLLIYLDADTTVAQQIKLTHLADRDSCEPGIDLLPMIHPGELQRSILEPNPDLLLKVVNNVLGILSGQHKKEADLRIAKVEELIAVSHPSVLNIKYLAENVFLSESRLRALFKEKTGVSIYKYLMWSRIRFGINRIMAGNAVNEAALEAGFTDSSHFHKMMVNMFGLSPSQFMKDNQKLNIVTCDRSPLKFETSVYNGLGEVERVYR